VTCCVSLSWRGTIVLVFLATAGFALPREPWVKLDRARSGSARQSTAGRNELDAGKPRLMFASEEEPAGYQLPGQGLISPVQAWPAWTEHRRCSAVGAQIHLFGRDRKGQTEAGTAVHIGRFAFVLGSLCVTAVLYGQLRPAAATAGRSCASGCAVTERRPRRRRRRCRWRAGPAAARPQPGTPGRPSVPRRPGRSPGPCTAPAGW
jgi:hypothetical protein